jgi:hypothetical protein
LFHLCFCRVTRRMYMPILQTKFSCFKS